MKDLTHLRHCSLWNFIKIEIHFKSLKKDHEHCQVLLGLFVCFFVFCFFKSYAVKGQGKGRSYSLTNQIYPFVSQDHGMIQGTKAL